MDERCVFFAVMSRVKKRVDDGFFFPYFLTSIQSEYNFHATTFFLKFYDLKI